MNQETFCPSSLVGSSGPSATYSVFTERYTRVQCVGLGEAQFYDRYAVRVQSSRFLEDHDIGNLLILKSIYKLDLTSLFDAWHLELVCFLYLDTSSVRSWLGDLTIEISRYPIDIGDLGNLFLGRDA